MHIFQYSFDFYLDHYNFYVDVLIIPVSQKTALSAKHYKSNFFQPG